MSRAHLPNPLRDQHARKRAAHWNEVACQTDTRLWCGQYYHRRLEQVYQFLVAPGQRVLELGCGQGDLLAALRPSLGIGVDFSWEMIKRARKRHPGLVFMHADTHDLCLKEKFDVVLLSDLVNDLWDVQAVFEQIALVAHRGTRVLINSYSRLWEHSLSVAQKLRLAKPALHQNWLTVGDIANLLRLADFEVVRHWEEILVPVPIPLLATLANRFLVKLWPFRIFALTNLIVAGPAPHTASRTKKPLVSVIVPARNEAGSIASVLARTPEMGGGTELVFVEGHSTDDTYAVLQRAIAEHPERRCTLLKQTGLGKGDAVRMGFAHANGDILMILDADLAVSPEDLPRFYEILRSGKGQFVNGVRLVYPMEKRAMRFLNLVVNKLFGMAFSWLLGQPIKDTLCGTKSLWKTDYERIADNRTYFGDFDPFGDFDLLFGAARLNLKIVDLPIRYHERTYGRTNIHRWKHGWLLLRMMAFAARRIRFV